MGLWPAFCHRSRVHPSLFTCLRSRGNLTAFKTIEERSDERPEAAWLGLADVVGFQSLPEPRAAGREVPPERGARRNRALALPRISALCGHVHRRRASVCIIRSCRNN